MMNGLKQYADVGHLLLRLAIAAIFLYHGHQKWGMWSASPDGMPSMMVNLFRLLSIVEPLGGIALILGLFTRLASLGLGIIMIGAIYLKITMMNIGFATPTGPGWEFDLMILAGCIALFFEGAGKYALDSMLWKKNA
jgi:putative oxidoreductase